MRFSTLPRTRGLTALAALASLACSEPDAGLERGNASAAPRIVRWAAPSPLDSERCLDVGLVRACYPGARGPQQLRRPVPPGVNPQAVRCFGAGLERECRPRRDDASAFECNGERCEQRVVRLPDAGEWECAEPAGVLLCRGGIPAAGVVPGPPTAGFVCGRRRGKSEEKLCADYSPDRPRHAARSCSFRYDARGLRRECVVRAERLAGDACPDGACPPGLSCTSGHCLPQSLTLECWGHKDCAPGERCVLARCVVQP